MKVYLVRHGKAHSKLFDTKRSLTDEGKEEVIKVGSFLLAKEKTIEVAKIFQSGKARAHETAKLIALFIQPSEGIFESKDLEPMAEPTKWFDKINKLDQDLMLVGHLPHLDRLELLLTNNEKEKTSFAPATIVCLSKEEKNFTVEWMVSPGLV